MPGALAAADVQLVALVHPASADNRWAFGVGRLGERRGDGVGSEAALAVGSRRGVHGGEGGGGDVRGDSFLCARGDRSDDREGRLDLRGFSEGGCEHLLHGDGVRVPSDCHRDDGVDFGLIRVNRGADLLLVVILRKSGAGRGRQRVSVGRVREGAGNPRRVSRIGADRLNGVFVQRARATHLRLDVLRGDSDSGTLGIWFLNVRGSRARYASGARHGARNCSGGSRMRASDLTHYYVHRLASSKGGVRTQSPYLSEIFVF